MKKNIGNYYLIFLNVTIIIYTLYISLSVFSEKVILADDLSKLYESKSVSGSYFSFIYSFLDSATMAARPISGVITGSLMYFSRYHESFYLLGIFFFPLSLAVIYSVAKKIFSPELTSLITLLYSCSVLATSIQFSAIMLNSNLATIFFSLSIYFLYVRKKIILSSLLFIVSVLCYEIFLPLVLLHLFLIKENKQRWIFALSTLGFIIVFRKIIQPILFINSYQRDEINKIFDSGRLIQIIIYSIKLFFKDIFSGIYRSILNYKNLQILEWALAVFMSLLVYKVFSGYDFKNQSECFKSLAIISSITVLCSMSIFVFSSYIPTVFGFDNRNLGAVRLFFTLFIIAGVIFMAVKIKLTDKTIAAIFSIISFALIITNINVKNSWVYANRFNHELFGKLQLALKEKHIVKGEVCVDYNMFHELKTNPHFTFREPVFYNTWEAPMLCEMSGINPHKIYVYNVERKKDCEIIFRYTKGKLMRTK